MTAPKVDVDHLLGGRVRLRQANGFRAAIDSVFLAAAVPARVGESILEFGIGNGAASLCLAARVQGLAHWGLELDPATASLARENFTAAGLAPDRVITGDVAEVPAALKRQSFDHVLFNPPYFEAPRSQVSPDADWTRSAHEGPTNLGRWLVAAGRRLKPEGSLTLILPGDRMDQALAAMDRFGAIKVFPLWARVGEPAKRILIQGRKGRKTPITLLPGMVLHGEGAEKYTPEADAVLRDAEALVGLA